MISCPVLKAEMGKSEKDIAGTTVINPNAKTKRWVCSSLSPLGSN